MSHSYDLLIHGGTIVSGTRSRDADIAVSDGRIAAVIDRSGIGARPDANTVIDASGHLVLPGLIDSHVHFREPGRSHKEDWAHASAAAVSGGVTTVIDMPNTLPALTSPRLAYDKAEAIAGRSLVDYAFHGGIRPGEVSALRAFGGEVASVKVFMSGHHTAPDVLHSVGELDALFAEAATVDRLLLFHAEDQGIFDLLDAWQGDPLRVGDYERYRPRTGAIVAVSRVIEMSRRHGTRAHVLHASSKEEVDLLAAAAASSIPVTFEVTGHHLTFTDTDVDELGTLIRLRPAIRAASDRDRLWAAVNSGQVAIVGSDHAPHTMAEKQLPVSDAPPGLPGVQELFHTLYTGLRRSNADLTSVDAASVVVALMAENPAKLFGLADRKGSVDVGKDADLAIVDPDSKWVLDPHQIHAKCGWSAYTGRPFVGQVIHTIRHGELVYHLTDDGPVFGQPTGQWLHSR